MIKKASATVLLILVVAFAGWYQFVALKEVPMPQSEIVSAYQYAPVESPDLELVETGPNTFSLTYHSYDGDRVVGQISYPPQQQATYPVLIGISAMGRSYVRWWTDSFKERPTVTQVNRIADLAARDGYVVISIDARYHGKRKDPNKTLRSIMNDMHFFGNKDDYEAMIRDTVLDHRVLLDWIERQDNLDKTHIKAVGYSMGGQIALLLASIDERVTHVISIVPPFVGDKIALVAPKNLVPLLGDRPVLLITASNDENASSKENDRLFELLPGADKERMSFDGGHILPENYVDKLVDRF